jgi:hypothetical protein
MKKQRTEITNENARFILSAYRVSGVDAQDPAFQQALEQAARDPELGAWFATQRDFDLLVNERLAEVKPPSNLRSAILAGMKTAQPTKRFSPRILLAIAAVLVAAALILQPMVTPKRAPAGALAQFQQSVTTMLTAEPVPKLDMVASRFAEIDDYLDQRHAPCATSLPPGLQNIPTAGCKTFQWNGATVSLTCFRLPTGELLHLFVVKEKPLEPFQLRGGIREINGWRMKCQRVNGMLLMFVTKATAAQMQQYI